MARLRSHGTAQPMPKHTHSLVQGSPGQAGQTDMTIWYTWNRGGGPLVVGPNHTVTAANGNFASSELTAWALSRSLSDPIDQQSVGGANAPSAQPGSITPSKPG